MKNNNLIIIIKEAIMKVNFYQYKVGVDPSLNLICESFISLIFTGLSNSHIILTFLF